MSCSKRFLYGSKTQVSAREPNYALPLEAGQQFATVWLSLDRPALCKLMNTRPVILYVQPQRWYCQTEIVSHGDLNGNLNCG